MILRNRKGKESRSIKQTTLLTYFFILIRSVYGGFACLKDPCFHGICIDYLDINSTHQCYCINGFTGFSCEINWDECRSSPCLNNGVCTDGIASFNCSCPENFTGDLCQYDLSGCTEHSPCQNNGTCMIDTSSSPQEYYCVCQAGFTGRLCETDISICNATQNICQNGGNCIDGVGESFHCQCPAGWEGRFCERQVDNCVSQPCQNGGICVNRVNDFGCACPFGYTGKTCEKKMKICEVNPCKNGGFCLIEHEDESNFTCYCVPDYNGDLCQYQYDDCLPPAKCFNGGTCIDGVGGFTCSCPPDWFGPTCQCTAENMTDPACQYNQTLIISEIFPIPSTIFPTSTLYHSIQLSELTPTTRVEITSPGLALTEIMPTETAEVTPTESDLFFTSATFYLSPSPEPFETTKTPEETPWLMSTSTFPPSVVTEQTTVSLEGSESTVSPSPTASLFSTPGNWMSVSPTEIISNVTTTPLPLESFPIISIPPTATPEIEGSSVPCTDSVIFATITVIAPTESITSELPSPSINHSVVPTTSLPASAFTSFTISIEPTVSYEFTTMELPRSESVVTETPILPVTIFPELSLSTTLPATVISTHVFHPDETVTLSPVFNTTITGELEPQTFSIIDSSPSVSNAPTESIPALTEMIIPTPGSVTETTAFPESPTTIIVPFPTPLLTSSIPETFTSVDMMTTEVVSQTFIFPTATVTTVEPPVSISLSPTTTPIPETTTTVTPNATDLCHNYCFNKGKCIPTSIQPICICPFKFLGNRCEIPRKKFTTVSFTGDSFLEYSVPNGSINRINAITTIATNAPDSILFYTGSGSGRLYVLVFTQGGHVGLHFSCGAQSMHFIESRTRVDNGHNFTLDISLEMIIHAFKDSDIHCVGQVSVNHSYIMRGEQIVGHNVLTENPIEFIYFGGVDNTNINKKTDDLLAIMPGLRGCMYTLSINGEEKDLFDDAINGIEIGDCSAFGCVTNPCFGSSQCAAWNKYPFWQCICPPGFQGDKCQIPLCDKNPCMNGGTCTFLMEENSNNGYTNITTTNATSINSTSPHDSVCLCPLGFSGSQCQSKINITKPSFKPIGGFDYSSFIAYEPIPRFADWVQLKLHFVTRNFSQIALVMYTGHSPSTSVSSPDEAEAFAAILKKSFSKDTSEAKSNESNNGNGMAEQHVSDLFAITFVHGYVALTWNLGSGTQRIITPSRIDRRINVHTLFAGRSGRQAWLKVDGMRNITGKSPGPFHRLNTNTELFLGGHDNFRFEGLPHDLPLHKGFEGCLFDFGFRVKNRLYLPQPLRGRNVKNCYEEDC